MSFLAYSKYKDIGVEWLGQMPEHWHLCKIKHLCQFTTGWTPPTGDAASYEGENLWANISDLGPKVISDTSKRISDEAVGKAGIAVSKAGSLLFSFKLSIGQVSFAARDLYTNEAIATFVGTQTLDLAYAFYAFPLFIPKNASVNIYGASLLNQELIRSADVVAPPIDEQKSIAQFLDHETAKIDALIDEQERLVELLSEKRTSVISAMVTKGLNAAAARKASNIEWIGDVPAHWEVKQIRHVAEVLRGKFTHRPRNDPAFYDGDFPFIQTGDITGASRYITGFKQTLNEKGASVSKEFPKGTLVMAIAANIGDVAILDFPAYFPDSIVGLVPKSDVDLQFLYFLMIAMRGPMIQTATVSTQMNLNVDQISALVAPCPPLDEQVKIAKFIDDELLKIDALVNEANSGIVLLQERRSALVTAAVTGKIDVRGFVAPSVQ